ncbi:MAG: PqqD family peptide modification chaperone [Alphaproteobacteria bacterium]
MRPDLTFLPLDGDAVVFSEETQQLIGLNRTAALLVEKLQRGIPASELAQALATEGLAAPDEAEQWVAMTLDGLRSCGVLDAGPVALIPSDTVSEDNDTAAGQAAECAPYKAFQPAAERRYRLLETCTLIRFGHVAQVRLVDSVIGHLATEDDAAPDIVMDISAKLLGDGHLLSDVYRNGAPIGRARRLSRMAPIVKAALWQSAINGHDFLFYLHAGVVGTGTSCILLPAAAGSGKSSLTVALVDHGFLYFSDEIALIEPGTFRVPPVPLAMCIKDSGWDLISRYYPQLLSLPVHVRIDEKVIRYIPPPPNTLKGAAVPVSHIIFPRYDRDAETRLEPIDRSAALGRLMGECLALRQRLDRENVRELVCWIAGIECYELTFSCLDAARQLIVDATAFARA